MTSHRAKLTATAIPLMLAATALITAPTASAGEAIACTHPSSSNKDADTGRVKGLNRASVPVHSGPAGSCSEVGRFAYTATAYYHCYRLNSAGNTWTHLRVDYAGDNDVSGWVWDEYLDDGGSIYHC
ncbi:SH3 domain-containing protein [Streptomyces sp. NPDC049879]|uniref:SH3 domain-containing protein n=1 Tax=Streptomyces sp. NPDC049879 TaxID=3365598 RepID=UPI0037ADD488